MHVLNVSSKRDPKEAGETACWLVHPQQPSRLEAALGKCYPSRNLEQATVWLINYTK